MTTAPTTEVLAAFGAPTATPRLLDGGQGHTWRAGDIVVKPTGDPRETEWRADVLASLADSAEFRVARPVGTADGGWIVDGWEAWHVVEGREDHRRPDDVLRAGAAFHAALSDIPRPAFLDTRDDPWTRGDRMAFDEFPLTGSDTVMPLLEELVAHRRSVDLRSQPVHGDLLGNVLFAPGLPPAIIDWVVYYRPTTWAAAVAVCDALTWHAAPADLVRRWSHLAGWKQMLIRALIYRIATDDALAGVDGPDPAALVPYGPVITAVTALAG
ncbi:TIGR02569 family protein [Phytoactinopolyspora halotolerans]|uniref:TIGR02569 family protein n=1 Tax=Phytoactinopolyspora halotolerans TaxID=1981512 RepID=A0A6L9SA15_9ACTN|nr:TIGR02569 family protein [Phytoactinopolyspora halotolerans]NEE01531.1 TIGR02569 family protein [Phytoactinopolyspora halotolerans]